MPDYFFHVAIEVAAEAHAEPQSQPPHLSHFFSALKPFANRTRSSRDTKYDRKSYSTANRTANIPKDPTGHSGLEVVGIHPTSPDDHRFDTIYLDGVDMTAPRNAQEIRNGSEEHNLVNKGIGGSLTTSYLKGHFQPTDESDSAAASWGIVHLYRDADPTPSLSLRGSAPYQSSDLWSDTPRSLPVKTAHNPPSDAECTTLCILAVPSYMTPADFLAFVGENTRDAVSHFRMVRTQRQNRYMVLMKFRDGKVARKWQAEWNGKIWNAMEPETCHVVFLKSVELIAATQPATSTASGVPPKFNNNDSTFPQLTGDPFNPTTTTRPFAPPTPSLVELPTCPVCLERMDETTGLLTIPCQHVFHCTCLQKWSGGGCPVCRYTHDDFSSRLGGTGSGKKYKKIKKLNADGTTYEYDVATDDNDGILECETCHEDGSLWQCLICGRVGCGRYKGKHAYKHFEETGHLFSMDLTSKRVWDYGGDGYVHRIMVEERLPSNIPGKDGVEVGVREISADSDYEDTLTIGGGKPENNVNVENLALEYTHLLTSQLESQRVYFEEIVERAVDKASEANKKADAAQCESVELRSKLTQLEHDNDFVTKGALPELQRERSRWETKAKKLEDMAKDINGRYLEEKATVQGLLGRIKHLEGTELAALKQKIQHLEEENATKELLMEGLREEHRDAMIQVSAERQLRAMVERGEVAREELEGAEVTVGKKPLSRAERLRERIEAEREARKGHGKAKAGGGGGGSKDGKKAAQAAIDKGVGDSKPVDVAEQAQSDDAESAFASLLGLGPAGLEKGDKWDEAEAAKLVAAVRIQMVQMGLLKQTTAHPGVEDTTEDAGADSGAHVDEDGVTAQQAGDPSTPDGKGDGSVAAKKRKSKGKGKGRGN